MAKRTGKKPPGKSTIAGFKPTAVLAPESESEATNVVPIDEEPSTSTVALSAPQPTPEKTVEALPTATVCMIVRNEKSYLVEWVAYYRQLGFNRILIYDNNSNDGSDVLLKAMAAAGKIDYRLWQLGRMESPQITAFNDAVHSLDTEWVFFADIDEFLVLHDHATVGEFLATFAERPVVGKIGINWRVFGDSFQDKFSNAPVIERFTWASEEDFGANRHFKTFTRVAGLRRVVNRHYCDAEGSMVHASGKPMVRLDYGYSEGVDLSVAQINHYYGKTWDEYRKKMARGQAGVGEVDAILKYGYTELIFNQHNANDVVDRSALKRIVSVTQEMGDLRALLK